jgi:RNA polymerase sigma-70 factor, ECF subfamily
VRDCPDEELIRRFAAGGDHAAFEALVRRHLPRIRRLLYGLFGGDPEDMQDAEQEILLALFRSLPRFGGRSTFATWLYRLVRNRGIDLIRRRERERRSLSRLGADAGAAGPHPEEVAVAAVERGEAMALLATLGASERLVVLLREVEGLSVQETARVLRLPAGTVKSRLHRARARIEARLQSRAGRS